MTQRTKILIGILAVGIVLTAGWWVWEQWFYLPNYCANLYNEFRNKIEKLDKSCQFNEDCKTVELLILIQANGAYPICVNKGEDIKEIRSLQDLYYKKYKSSLPNILIAPARFYGCECEQNVCIEITKKPQEVTIATDKTEYEQGEEVKITIRNDLDQEKWIYFPFYTIERFNNGSWVEIKKVDCPCEVACKIAAYFILQPYGTTEYQWDQKETWCSDPTRISKTISNQVPFGKYRIRSEISDVDDYKSKQTIYSNEFTIKKLNQAQIKLPFTVNCFNGCSPETNSLILETAEETLKVLQKEFPWMYEPALKTRYLIEVNPPGISGTSYVDYENRIVKLTRIYKPTIAHEIAHLLIAESFGLEEDEFFDEVLPRGPTWLQEGLAMYLEYRVDDSRKATYISLLKSTSQFLSKEDFMQGVVNDSLKLFYVQSWSLTEFLITKGGKERLRLMIEEVREHPRELVIVALWEESFNKIYQDVIPNWSSFYEEWTEYIKQNF